MACCDCVAAWARAATRPAAWIKQSRWLTRPVRYRDNWNYLCLVYFTDKAPCRRDTIEQFQIVLVYCFRYILLLIHYVIARVIRNRHRGSNDRCLWLLRSDSLNLDIIICISITIYLWIISRVKFNLSIFFDKLFIL